MKCEHIILKVFIFIAQFAEKRILDRPRYPDNTRLETWAQWINDFDGAVQLHFFPVGDPTSNCVNKSDPYLQCVSDSTQQQFTDTVFDISRICIDDICCEVGNFGTFLKWVL